jgi:hypothetical protein
MNLLNDWIQKRINEDEYKQMVAKILGFK